MRLRLTLTAFAAAFLTPPAFATSCIAPQDLTGAERSRIIEDMAFGAVAFHGIVDQPLDPLRGRAERIRVTRNIIGATRPSYSILRHFEQIGGRLSMTVTAGDEQYPVAGAEAYEVLTPRANLTVPAPFAYSWLRPAFDNMERLFRYSIMLSRGDVALAQDFCSKLFLRDDADLLDRAKARAQEIGR